MSDHTPHQRTRPRWTVVSVALAAVGLLILVPSGLCTMAFGVPFVLRGNLFASNAGIVQLFLLFGCILMALGAALVYAGLKSRRRD